MTAFTDWVVEELEQHLEELRASLEVEEDLHGSRTRMAHDLRVSIIKTEQEVERLKTANMV